MAYDKKKFEDLNKVIKPEGMAPPDFVEIDNPTVLGDTYEEVIENLSRIADAGSALAILKRKGT